MAEGRGRLGFAPDFAILLFPAQHSQPAANNPAAQPTQAQAEDWPPCLSQRAECRSGALYRAVSSQTQSSSEPGLPPSSVSFQPTE